MTVRSQSSGPRRASTFANKNAASVELTRDARRLLFGVAIVLDPLVAAHRVEASGGPCDVPASTRSRCTSSTSRTWQPYSSGDHAGGLAARRHVERGTQNLRQPVRTVDDRRARLGSTRRGRTRSHTRRNGPCAQRYAALTRQSPDVQHVLGKQDLEPTGR